VDSVVAVAESGGAGVGVSTTSVAVEVRLLSVEVAVGSTGGVSVPACCALAVNTPLAPKLDINKLANTVTVKILKTDRRVNSWDMAVPS